MCMHCARAGMHASMHDVSSNVLQATQLATMHAQFTTLYGSQLQLQVTAMQLYRTVFILTAYLHIYQVERKWQWQYLLSTNLLACTVKKRTLFAILYSCACNCYLHCSDLINVTHILIFVHTKIYITVVVSEIYMSNIYTARYIAKLCY